MEGDYDDVGNYTGEAMRRYLHERLQEDRDELQEHQDEADLAAVQNRPSEADARMLARLQSEFDARTETLAALDAAATIYGMDGTDKQVVKRVLRSLAVPYQQRDDFAPWRT